MSSFTFYKDSARTAAAADLSDAKVMIYKDGGGNEYILDTSGIINLDKIDNLKLSSLKDITIKYQPKGSSTGIAVEGLGSIMDKLFATQSAENGQTFFEGIVAKKPIVEAILYAKDGNDIRISDTVLANTFARKDDTSSYIGSKLSTKADKGELDKKADADNVYTKEDIDEKLETKADADNVYTKEDIDEKLETKADADNVYTKEDIDEKSETKADADNVYTKKEANKQFFPLTEHRKLAQNILEKYTDDGGSILVKTLGKFLDENHVWYGDDRNQTAKDFLAQKGEFTKIDGANIKIPDFINKILDATEDVGEGKKKSVLVEKLGKFLDQTTDNDKAYEGKIAKDFLGEKVMQGPNGAQGPAGRDGESPSANDVAAQLLNGENKDKLANEVASNEGLQKAVAGNQGLRTAVTNTLKGDGDFHNIVRRDLSRDGESLSVDDIVTKLFDNKEKRLVNAIGDNKEVAEKILGATGDTDGKKSILVERLAGFLDIGDQAYDDNTRTAKEFLNSKGLTPSADALVTAAIAEDTNFMDNVKTMAVSNNSVFREAVREVMSKPFFEIPNDPNQPLSWDW